MSEQGGMESRLPVFSTPQQQITFYADDPTHSRHILTVFNPYEFLVKFKIACTDPSKYHVAFPQGQIKPNHSVDIIIQHKAMTTSNIGVTDTLRIQLYTLGQARTSGRKDITLTLLATAPKEHFPASSIEPERFQQFEAESAVQLRQHPLLQERNTNGIIIYSAFVVICLILLSLPKVGDESEWPESIPRLSCEFKLWVAFFLGGLTVLLIRS